MKIIKIAATVPTQYIPEMNTPYVYNKRIIDVTSISPRTGRSSNKEYIVRIYHYPNGNYGTIAFYGRIGSSLAMDWKGSSQHERVAITTADGIIFDRLHDNRKNYEMAPNIVNSRIPGIEEREDLSDEPEITVPSAPIPAPSPETQSVTMREFEGMLGHLYAMQPDDTIYKTIVIDVNTDSIDIMKKYPLAEKLVHDMLNGEYREKILEIPKDFFDRIRMSPEDRQIVNEHFGVEEEVEEEEEVDLSDILSKNKRDYKRSSDDWYMDLSDSVSDDLVGYFKYSVVSDENERGFYDIWWKGFSSSLRITEHNMPVELFREHRLKIEATSRSKAEDAYKEVTASLAGGL